MANLQRAFIDFHDSIKLDDENEILREKRDILLEKLKANISSDAASYKTFNQGSYAIHTGISPDDGDYDIDVGIKFDINQKDHSDPVKIKKWVYDALYGHTKSVEIRRSCVTVQYQAKGEALYHVDFAVYAANNDDGKLYIAKGKENSLPENRKWDVSDPQGLISLITAKHTGKDAEQFHRVIRYLKKWVAHNFTLAGNSAPTGISLTVLAYSLFSPNSSYDPITCSTSYDDFHALYDFAISIKNSFNLSYDIADNKYFQTISISLPVEPNNDLFDKMTIKQQDAFYNQLVTMIEKLDEAEAKNTLSETCTVLAKLFGDEFPIKTQRSMVSSTESA